MINRYYQHIKTQIQRRPKIAIYFNFALLLTPWIAFCIASTLFNPLFLLFNAAITLYKIRSIYTVVTGFKPDDKDFEAKVNNKQYEILNSETRGEKKRLFDIINNLAIQAKLENIVYYIDNTDLFYNAHLGLTSPSSAKLGINKGLADAFLQNVIDEESVKSTIGHEFGHYAHKHAIGRAIAQYLGNFNFDLSFVSIYLAMIGAFASAFIGNSVFMFPLLSLFIFGCYSMLCSNITKIFWMGISRAQELEADIYGIHLTNNPEAQAKLSKNKRKISAKNGYKTFVDQFGNESCRLHLPMFTFGFKAGLFDENGQMKDEAREYFHNLSKAKKQKIDAAVEHIKHHAKLVNQNINDEETSGFDPLGPILKDLEIVCGKKELENYLNDYKKEHIRVGLFAAFKTFLSSFNHTHPSLKDRKTVVKSFMQTKPNHTPLIHVHSSDRKAVRNNCHRIGGREIAALEITPNTFLPANKKRVPRNA